MFPGVPSENLIRLHYWLRDHLPHRIAASSYSSFLW
ncbi:MAG: hypothetical protein KME08_16480 [Aphanothece sp. CMT-3BRIN-NPC111]|nr:hypothetical protein [Aphanothece sp. CMT-3BRIN-NPC111]